MKRGKPSGAWPKASGSGENLGRMRWRPLRGVSRLPFAAALPAPLTPGLFGALSANAASKPSDRSFAVICPPVIRQQMVQDVIDRHGPHQPARLVDHGKGIQVVGGKGTGNLTDMCLVRQGFQVL